MPKDFLIRAFLLGATELEASGDALVRTGLFERRAGRDLPAFGGRLSQLFRSARKLRARA